MFVHIFLFYKTNITKNRYFCPFDAFKCASHCSIFFVNNYRELPTIIQKVKYNQYKPIFFLSKKTQNDLKICFKLPFCWCHRNGLSLFPFSLMLVDSADGIRRIVNYAIGTEVTTCAKMLFMYAFALSP